MQMAAKKMRNIIKSKTPSSWWGATWREGFFSGNGLIGANVYGGAVNETVLLTSRDLTWQGRTNVVPDVSAKVRDARKLIDGGKFLEAQGVYPQALIQKNFRPSPELPLPLCELKIKTFTEKQVKDFNRELNMENGEVSVSFTDGATKHFRSSFVSRADNSAVFELKKSGGKMMDVEFSFAAPNVFNNRSGNSIVSPPDGMTAKYEKFFMYFSGRHGDGFDFGAIAKIAHFGGTQTVSESGVRIAGAEKILVTVKLFAHAQKEKEWVVLKNALTANKDTYEKMLKAHTVLHSKHFNSAVLEFGGDGEQRDGTAESMIKETRESGVSSALLEKLWSYGRYLFISGCGQNGRVFLPTGLWSGEYKNLKSAVNNAGVLQACYRHALIGNLGEFMLPLFDYYEQRLGDFKDNAMRLFDVHGIFIPANCAPETGRIGSIKPDSLYFTGCAALTAAMFYDYYNFTQDVKFLKSRALPFLTEAATFYEEFITVNKNGEVEFSPSSSPVIFNDESDENDYVIVGKNATADFALARQTLSNAIEASKIANANKDRIEKWRALLDKIPAASVGKDGTVPAYAETSAQEKPSAAMLWAAYPLTVVDNQSPVDEVKAVISTAKDHLVKKLQCQTSASLAFLGAVFARMGDGSLALESLDAAVKGAMVSNLTVMETDWRGMGYMADSQWASMQLMGNLSMTDAVQQTFVGGKADTVSVLPVHLFPDENLSLSGFQCPGGLEIDLNYNAKGQTLVLEIKGRRNSAFNIKLPGGIKKMTKAPSGTKISDDLGLITGVELKAGKAASYAFKYSPK